MICRDNWHFHVEDLFDWYSYQSDKAGANDSGETLSSGEGNL